MLEIVFEKCLYTWALMSTNPSQNKVTPFDTKVSSLKMQDYHIIIKKTLLF